VCALSGVGQCCRISSVGQCVTQVICSVGTRQGACGSYVLSLLIKVAFDGGSRHQWVPVEGVKGESHNCW